MTVLPDRIARLRDEAVRRGGSFACAYPPCLDDAALWRAWEPGMSVVQVRAAMLREIAAEVDLLAAELVHDLETAGLVVFETVELDDAVVRTVVDHVHPAPLPVWSR